MRIEEQINKKINENSLVFVLNRHNINMQNLLNCSNNVITYYSGDKLLTNYTRLIHFFSANIQLQTKQEYVNEIPTSYHGIINAIIKGIKNLYKHIRYRRFYKIKKQFSNYDFTNNELNLMTKIEKYSIKIRRNKTKNQSNILLINNVHEANQEDIIFIKNLYERKFFECFAKNLKIILVTQAPSFYGIDVTKLKNTVDAALSDWEICEYLKSTHPNILLKDEKILQYIKLCHRDVDLLNTIIIANENNSITEGCSLEEILQKIIFDILNNNPKLNVLKIAAVIGLSFELNLLNQLCEWEVNELIFSLNQACECGLLTEKTTKYNYQFISLLIKNIIGKETNNPELNIKYAEIINESSPDEHLLIAKNYYLGQNNILAVVHYWSYLFSSIVENQTSVRNTVAEDWIKELIDNNLLIKSCDIAINELLLLHIEKRITKKDVFKFIEDKNNNNVTDYMLAYVRFSLCYINKMLCSNDEYIQLGNEFEKLYDFFKEKKIYGLVIKIAFYLLDIYSYRLNHIKKAKDIQNDLEQILQIIFYNKSNCYIGRAQTLQLKLARKTAMLLNAELAFEKTRILLCAMQETDNAIDELEKYKFLSDHLGYALYSGEFNSVSKEVIENVKLYLTNFTSLKYPKRYKLETNYLLYRLYNNELLYDEAEQYLEKFLKQSVSSSMYRFNVAALCLYCGRYKMAEKILLDLYDGLKTNDTCFYRYCFCSNLAALYLLKKDYDKAKYFNDQIIEKNYDWYDDFKNIMKYRAELFNGLINIKKSFSPIKLFNCFEKAPIKYSQTWLFLGKGIIFSELMFYRE